MSKKVSTRKMVAFALSLLAVTGNVLAPAAPLNAFETGYVAEASSLWESGYSFDAATGTLTVTGTIHDWHDADFDNDEEISIYSTVWGVFGGKLDTSKVKKIIFSKNAKLPENCQAMFACFTNLKTVEFQNDFDAKGVRKLSRMFERCTSLETVKFTGLKNAAGIEYTEEMFSGCTALKHVDLSSLGGENICNGYWTDHQAIEHIRQIVKGCKSLETLTLSDSFIYYAIENVKKNDGDTTLDAVLDKLLDGLNSPNYDRIRRLLKEQYERYIAALSEARQFVATGWAWKQTADGWACKVTVEKKATHETKVVTADVDVTFNPAATCTEDGVAVYTASWTNASGKKFVCTETKQKKVNAIGHDWNAPEYEADFEAMTVTAKRVCKNDASHIETETALITADGTAATCENGGRMVYTASFQNTAFSWTKTVVTDALGHQWAEPTYAADFEKMTVTATRVCLNDAAHTQKETAAINADETPATCGNKGKIIYTASFENEVFSWTKTVETGALGHDWNAPTYVADFDAMTVTAKRVCKNDASHIEVETAAINANETPATCENKGKTVYTASFANSAFSWSKTVETAKIGHDWNEPTYVADFAAMTVTATRVCKNDTSHIETETAAINVDETPATCDNKGSIVYMASFENEAFSWTNTVETDELGHQWAAPTYVADLEALSVTATRICLNDAAHTQVETAAIDFNEVPADCVNKGQINYSATFENEAFSWTNTVETDALGHDWGEWTVIEEPTYDSEGIEERICSRCGESETRMIDALQRTDISDYTVSGLDDRLYDGSVSTEFVYFGDDVLSVGSDYEIIFTKNGEEDEPCNAGTYNYTITGIGAYEGEITGSFTISKNIFIPSVSIENWLEGEEPKEPVVTGVLGDGELTFKYTSNGINFTEDIPFDAGHYILMLTVAESENYHQAFALCEFDILSREEQNFVVAQNYQLALDGKIGVIFRPTFASDVTAPVMKAQHANFDTVTVEGKLIDAETNKYEFIYYVAAKEMADEITYSFEGTRDEETAESETYTFSVQEFAKRALPAYSGNADLCDLVAKMVNYGAKAQAFFGYNTENPADAVLAELNYTVTQNPDEVSADADVETVNELAAADTKATFYRHTLSLDSDVSMICVFDLDADVAANTVRLGYRVSGSDDAYKYVKVAKRTDGRYEGIIPGIQSPDLCKRFDTVVCVETEDGMIEISNTESYSAECYARKILNEYTGAKADELKDLVIAMIMYGNAAQKYFG